MASYESKLASARAMAERTLERVHTYEKECGRLERLADLAAEGKCQFSSAKQLLDPYGNAFLYVVDLGGSSVVSRGEDGRLGTSDDVLAGSASWKQNTDYSIIAISLGTGMLLGLMTALLAMWLLGRQRAKQSPLAKRNA